MFFEESRPDAPPAVTGLIYFNDRADGLAKTESYLLQEFLPHIDKYYQTCTDPNNRLLTGFSAGGHAVERLVLKHPDQFGSVVTYDGGNYDLSDNVQFLIGLGAYSDEEDVLANSPVQLIDSNFPANGQTNHLILTGDVQSALYNEMLNTKGMSSFYYNAPGVDHHPTKIMNQFPPEIQEFMTSYLEPCSQFPDFDQNGVLDYKDLNQILFNYGTEGPAGDANADGVVDETDLAIYLEAFEAQGIK